MLAKVKNVSGRIYFQALIIFSFLTGCEWADEPTQWAVVLYYEDRPQKVGVENTEFLTLQFTEGNQLKKGAKCMVDWGHTAYPASIIGLAGIKFYPKKLYNSYALFYNSVRMHFGPMYISLYLLK